MPHYRYRLNFRFGAPCVLAEPTGFGTDDGSITDVWFVTPSGSRLNLRACMADSIGKAMEFEISEGGHESPELAWEVARADAVALLVIGAVLGVGVDVGPVDIGPYHEGVLASGSSISRAMCEAAFEGKPTQPINHRRGITIIEQTQADDDYATIRIQGHINPHPLSVKGLFASILRIWDKLAPWDESDALALELYNAGFFEHSLRTRFLTWVLLLESVAKPKRRSDQVSVLVDELLATVTRTSLDASDDLDLQAIKSQLSHMRSESITQSLQRLAEDTAPGADFMGLIRVAQSSST